MPEIKYKLVDGEPVCTGMNCPKYGYGNTDDPKNSTCFRTGSPCIPGLREQRDARPTEEDWKALIEQDAASGERIMLMQARIDELKEGEL